MVILALFLDLPLGEGFGFNTNILETNIINLAVVIAVVISFVGDAVRSLLENRKQTVLNNLREAEQRAKEAQEKLNQAQLLVQLAKKKAIEIREQAITIAEQQKLRTFQQTEQDVRRLEELKYEMMDLQQQKALFQISRKVVALALLKVRLKLNQSLSNTVHSSVNNFNIVLLTNYKSKYKLY